MNLWGKGSRLLVFLFLILFFACDDDSYLLGFRSPDENFRVVFQEFTLPTTVFRVDSLITSNSSTAPTNRLMVGSYRDSRYGAGTATAYMQYFPTGFPVISDTAVYENASMTMVYDLYHYGDSSATPQTYEFFELADSVLNYRNYYTSSSTPYFTRLAGSATRSIDPPLFDELAKQNNADNVAANNTIDSLNIDLSEFFGRKIFTAVRATDSASIEQYRNFSNWKKVFRGLAMVPVSTDKIVGFDPAHAKTRITIWFREKSGLQKIELTISPLNFLASYSGLEIDQTGTPLGAITEFYQKHEPAGGLRYIHSGSGVVTRIDLSDVYSYFENIPVKALNVAELSISTAIQYSPPLKIALRAVRADNHAVLGTARGINEAYDSITYADPKFVSKHFINPNSAPRADVLGDDGNLFTLDQKSNNGTFTYKGYMTTFLQNEVHLADKDYLRYFSLLPTSPEFGKSVNGLYFHADSVKLKIFYTAPIIEE